MGAPKEAITLKEENPKWAKKNVDAKIKCRGCGYKGWRSELLCVEDEDTLWCPQCRSIAWVYE
jgi:hypothetical protein